MLDIKFLTNEKIIVATNSCYLKEIDLNSLNTIVWKAHQDIVMCLDTFGNTVYSAGKDNLVKIW